MRCILFAIPFTLVGTYSAFADDSGFPTSHTVAGMVVFPACKSQRQVDQSFCFAYISSVAEIMDVMPITNVHVPGARIFAACIPKATEFEALKSAVIDWTDKHPWPIMMLSGTMGVAEALSEAFPCH
jgi:hypothetical protein